MRMEPIILASASPRRAQLLDQIGIPYRVVVSGEAEHTGQTDPAAVVRELSAQKAGHVAAGISSGVVLGADTVVAKDGMILGKPADRQQAKEMLQELSGGWHSVCTGVTIILKQDGEERVHTFSCETGVKVHELSDAEIEAYLDTGDPFDKAGAYGIQGPFGAHVDEIRGDYNNVVGLPLAAVYLALKDLGVLKI